MVGVASWADGHPNALEILKHSRESNIVSGSSALCFSPSPASGLEAMTTSADWFFDLCAYGARVEQLLVVILYAVLPYSSENVTRTAGTCCAHSLNPLTSQCLLRSQVPDWGSTFLIAETSMVTSRCLDLQPPFSKGRSKTLFGSPASPNGQISSNRYYVRCDT